MTTGTIYSFDADHGTGTVQAASGAVFPFSSKNAALAAGDEVSFSLVGGIAGVYALDVTLVKPHVPSVAHAAAPARPLPRAYAGALAVG